SSADGERARAALALQMAALEDAHYSVRAAAIASLGRVFEKPAEESSVRTILGEQQVSEVVEKLLPYADDEFTSVRLATFAALGKMRAENAVDVLQSKLTAENRLIQLAVLDALRKIDTEQARAVVRNFEQPVAERAQQVEKP